MANIRPIRKLGEPDFLKQLFESASSPEDYVLGFLQRMAWIMERLDIQAISSLIRILDSACEKGNQVFLIGNGGSSAVASHFVADLSSNTVVTGRDSFRAICLSDNVESITAIANDLGYEKVFSHQLRCHLKLGDVLIALSVSGNSENVIQAVDYALNNGAVTVGITGFDGGRLAGICEYSIHIPTTRDEYGPVEDLFSCVGHIVTGYLSMKRGRLLSH